MKGYYKQLYVHKFNNLDEMNQFLERPYLPKLTQREVDNLKYRSIPTKETELVLSIVPKQKAPNADEFTGEFYHIFKEEIDTNSL